MRRPPAHPPAAVNAPTTRTLGRITFGATAVAAALLLSACGGATPDDRAGGTVIDGNAEPSAATAGTTAAPGMTAMPGMAMPAAATAPTGGAPVATNTVAISNFAFGPATATVKVGTTVTWTNQDTDPHTVTSQNDGPLKSATLQKGDTYTFTFTKPGTFDYLCTIHPFMTASVVVTP